MWCMQISISLKPDVIAHIDEVKGQQSRSAFILACVFEHFSGGDVDKKQLLAQIEGHKVQQRRLEDEVAYLREQNARMLDAVAQKLLTESTPKKSFWSRLRRK